MTPTRTPTLQGGEHVRQVERLRAASIALNAAIDAMWNDISRVKENRIHDRHVDAIVDAQGKLAQALAETTQQDSRTYQDTIDDSLNEAMSAVERANASRADWEPAMKREYVRDLLGAVLGIYSCRAGSFAAGYAIERLNSLWHNESVQYQQDSPSQTEAGEPVRLSKSGVALSLGDRVRVHTGEEGEIVSFAIRGTKCVHVMTSPTCGGMYFPFECDLIDDALLADANAWYSAGQQEEIARAAPTPPNPVAAGSGPVPANARHQIGCFHQKPGAPFWTCNCWFTVEQPEPPNPTSAPVVGEEKS